MKDIDNQKKEYRILKNSDELNRDCFVGWCIVTDVPNEVDTVIDNKDE